jgi:UDP-2,3-diacylglucosamine pyrophosphatase LpxH
MKLRYRTIWISDVHLGNRGCKAEYLLDFLNHTESEYLYLVGDIIDIHKLKSGLYWPASHNAILRRLMDKAGEGTRVVYIPGNHDEIFRKYAGMHFNGVDIQKNAMHVAADGRLLFVLHGDEFDHVACDNRWLVHLGGEAYEVLIQFNHWFNLFRDKLGYPYWSLSKYLKYKVKNALTFIEGFRGLLLREALSRGAAGVICGHIHHAELIENAQREIYCNCGDWVENCTALAEDGDGHVSLLRWSEESAMLLDNAAISVAGLKEAA